MLSAAKVKPYRALASELGPEYIFQNKRIHGAMMKKIRPSTSLLKATLLQPKWLDEKFKRS
jgi:hypothetical protein